MALEDSLRALGYTPEWLDLGVFTEEGLRAQHERLCHSEDKNPEHYRAHAWCEWLTAQSTFEDADLPRLVRLSDVGPDEWDLRDDRLLALLEHEGLSDAQFERLSDIRDLTGPPFEWRYARERIRRALVRQGLDEVTRNAMRSSADATVHGWWLDREELSVDDLAWLSASGANKGIRNRAAALARSRRFRPARD